MSDGRSSRNISARSSRLIYTSEDDPLCYPGTSVLRNLLDITDPQDLEEAELAFFLIRAEEPMPAGNLDFEHYRAIHRHLFQDVYPWAGAVRNIRIGKGGNWFAYPEYIVPQMHIALGKLGNVDEMKSLNLADFAALTAHVLAEINAIHPFREGNGRTQLTFLAMLAEHSGYSFNADVLERKRVMGAMINSFAGDEQQLVELIMDLIS